MMDYHDDALVWTAAGEAPIGCASCSDTFAGVTIVIVHLPDLEEAHVCFTCSSALLSWTDPQRRRRRSRASAAAPTAR
jgi:hypothetical protein